ncbi:thermonuclease family protein [Paracraurococcus lichenis]|uniref:Thermonuclease family protein n=1 Tax=Paracraurococcus lichenis TaxID=3064888 RepID=A0ABT9DZY0_9PROT|nr:thermonuclease family protein [Paracraurococcus sp. LOR1-02]MDO9709444.1 thermonuclease family protein [Paracraurococcus sp. LOR1-02]
MRIRRIFRPSLAARLRLPLAVAACLGISAALIPAALPGGLSGASGPPRVVSVPAAEVRVLDGGTLRLGAQVLRLEALRVPDRGRAACRDAAGGAQDCGSAAAAALAALVAGRDLACRVRSEDRQGRATGTCEAGGVEINASLVAAGWALADAGAAPGLLALEATARQDGRGVWGAASPTAETWRRGL